jgi:hypothetical protein
MFSSDQDDTLSSLVSGTCKGSKQDGFSNTGICFGQKIAYPKMPCGKVHCYDTKLICLVNTWSFMT